MEPNHHSADVDPDLVPLSVRAGADPPEKGGTVNLGKITWGLVRRSAPHVPPDPVPVLWTQLTDSYHGYRG